MKCETRLLLMWMMIGGTVSALAAGEFHATYEGPYRSYEVSGTYNRPLAPARAFHRGRFRPWRRRYAGTGYYSGTGPFGRTWSVSRSPGYYNASFSGPFRSGSVTVRRK